MDANASILSQTVPDFSLILGELPPVQELPPQESQNRFQQVILGFFKIFAKNDIPIAIFLDDLQWADSSLLTLIQSISLEPDLKNIILIGAYRDNEVSDTHPLKLMIQEIEKAHKIEKIVLNPLKEESIKTILMESMHRKKEELEALTPLIIKKTGGNPFFVVQFLKHLYKEKLLFLNEKLSGWDWNLEKIQDSKITENVVELLSLQLKELDQDSLKIVKYAACIGNQFTLRDLSILLKAPQSAIAKYLEKSIYEGFIIPLSKDYLYAINSESDFDTIISYRFQHDRIQQAAYELTVKNDREQLHLQIARNLYSVSKSENSIDEELFQILNHWNQVLHLVDSSEESALLKELNYMAGKKAKSSGAYKPALSFFEIAKELLKKSNENEDGNLLIYLETIECRYLSEQYETALLELEEVEKIYKKDDEILRIYLIKARLYTKWNKLTEVLDLFIKGLNLVNFSIPKSNTATLLQFLYKLVVSKIKLIGKTPEDLGKMPISNDTRGSLLLSLYIETAAAIFTQNQNLYVLASIMMFLLVLEKGNLPGGCFPYSSFGVIHTALKDYKTAYEYGKLAVEASNMFPERKLDYWRMKYLLHQFLIDWVENMRETIPAMGNLEVKLIESGDPIYSGYAVIARSVKSIFLSHNFNEFLSKNEKHLEYFEVTKNAHCYSMFSPIIYSIKNLTGKTDSPGSFSTSSFDEEKDIEHRFSKEPPMQKGYYSCYKLLSLYHMGFYKEAGKLAIDSIQFIPYFLSMLLETELSFYIIVSLLADYDQSKKNYLKAANKLIKEFGKYFKTQPDNFAHLYFYINAEKESALGNKEKAREYYEKCISTANAGGFTSIEAKGCERLGVMEKANGNSKTGSYYITESYFLYESLGARGKSIRLMEEHPEIKRSVFSKVSTGTIAAHTSTYHHTADKFPDITGNNQLDYDTIIRSSQKLSAEIELEALVTQLVDILITNAGATKGIYYSYENGKLHSEVVRSTKSSVNSSSPESVIQNVLKRKKESVINNTLEDKIFKEDEYIQEFKPLSILCVPIMKQSELRGLLYLENDLTTDAFTKERLELINVLSSQASISIENARLYTKMTHLNKTYEKFVPRQFLEFLEKTDITKIELGDQTEKNMTILFSDIRNFTALSEKMRPEENFKFINSYLSYMGPQVRKNNGFIDKYIGDAIMALFPMKAEDGLSAAIDMQKELRVYNKYRIKNNHDPISIGIGLHTGKLMLGIIGEIERMEGTVISDAVNLASRIESLTKVYGSHILISEDTLMEIENLSNFNYRLVDTVKVKGKSESIRVYDVFDGLSDIIIETRFATKLSFELGIEAYKNKAFEDSINLFKKVLERDPGEKVAELYIQRCQQAIEQGIRDDWEGVHEYKEK